MSLRHSTPILIAGAGPCGTVLALSLAQAGIPVRLLERHPELPRDLRASTFHPPSLEMLDDLGLAQDLLALGLKADRYQYRDRQTGEVAEFDMRLIADDTRFPFRLQLEQYELTGLIVDKLKAYPQAEVLFDHQLLDATQDAQGVRARVRTPDGERIFDTPFLVGTDGAGSQVRKAAGIGFGGFTYDEKFLVVSTSFPFETVFDRLAWVNYVADPEEWCVILRTDKLWRVLVPVFPQSPDEEAELLSDAFVQSRLQHLYPRDVPYDIGHRTLYNVHQRVSETYVRGRMVLAGDACHINNPLGGMGMNGGLHDAVNLADKLIRIVRDGAAADAALALYDRQRRELAVRFVQEHTIQNKKWMESTDPDIQRKRQAMLMATAADPVRARAFIRERAMIDCLRESLAVT